MILFYRLSGILHVLYSAITKCLPLQPLIESDSSDSEDMPDPVAAQNSFSRIIPKEIAEMAVALTEYFQMQRKIYEDVSVSIKKNSVNCS